MLVVGGSLQRDFGHDIGVPLDNDNGFISDIAVRPDAALPIEPCNRLEIEFEGVHLLCK